ncbi:unnamed protein product [Effrenium voratum]|uniref:EF-hand domain-containing protein n=1 Tax=Effrenium voratum TaxID=2562239 RepID=A0AA36NG22_9DINO|nr:unnamed protein product [Effrenium voratum]CAJ1431265.1 unnamed protein product [Effrenium voratum]
MGDGSMGDCSMPTTQASGNSPQELDEILAKEATLTKSYSRTSSRRAVPINASYIEGNGTREEASTSIKGRVWRALNSYVVANAMAFVVLADSFCTCASVDARAAGQELSEAYSLIARVCLCLYCAELVCTFYVSGCQVLREWLGVVDLLIVLCGLAEELVAALVEQDIGLPLGLLRVFRLVRIARTIRLLKRLRMLRELYKLVVMMATVCRTLMWSFLLCFIVMTAFAMMMVEFVNPVVQELTSAGAFEDCPTCLQSTNSVMDANLLLFQTVVAGDSWGKVAVPVIRSSPATAVIFVGSLLTLVFGVLNLIVAVVVDTFADARLHDVEALAEELEHDLQNDREQLEELFQRIDKEGTGELTLDELMAGARNDAVFQSRLKVMDIDESDLHQLFHMIDIDQSGTLQVSEFIGPLSRWAHDSKTAPRFIKYNLIQTMQMQEDLMDMTNRRFAMLSDQMSRMSTQLRLMTVPATVLASTSLASASQSRKASAPHSGHTESSTISDEHEQHKPHTSSQPELITPATSPTARQTGDRVSLDAPSFSSEIHSLSQQIDAAVSQIDAKLEALLFPVSKRSSLVPSSYMARRTSTRLNSHSTFQAMYMAPRNVSPMPGRSARGSPRGWSPAISEAESPMEF